MQPMFFDGVWKELGELAAAAPVQPATRSRAAPRRSCFTGKILLLQTGDSPSPTRGITGSNIACLHIGKVAQVFPNLPLDPERRPADDPPNARELPPGG
jgi:hypothetical protein